MARFEEVADALYHGKVRRKIWEDSSFIFFNEEGYLVNSQGSHVPLGKLLHIDDWEVVEEEPTCTCNHGQVSVAVESDDNKLPTPTWKCPVHRAKKIEKINEGEYYLKISSNRFSPDKYLYPIMKTIIKLNEIIDHLNGEKK